MTVPRPARNSLERLLRPRSVVIVGASATPGALGASVLANLLRLGFPGDIYLINPSRTEIGDRPCLRSIEELPPGIDAAVLAIPRTGVLDAVRSLGRRGVGAAVIFSAGFAEGGDEGRAQQRELADIASEHGMLIEGPNCLGLINHVDGVALTFVETPATPLRGGPGIGIVSQSGAMACVLGTMLASRELAVSYSISTGNEAVTGVEDFLEHLLGDPHTRVIGLIVEQFRAPKRFLALARRARHASTRIVLLHPGRSSAARGSAATHTGAMAGDYALMQAKVATEGVVLVESLEELGDVLEIAQRCTVPPCLGTVVVTESGAFKALTLDLCDEVGLALPQLNDFNAPTLRAVMPCFVPVSNPLDLTAQGLVDPDIYRRTLLALAADDRVGTIVIDIIQTDAPTCERKFPSILAALGELQPSSKAILFAGLDEGAAVPPRYVSELRLLGVPYFPSPDRAVRALARLAAAASQKPLDAPLSRVLERASLPSGIIPEHRAKAFLAPLGVPFPAGQLVQTLEQALQAAHRLGYPLALKAQSPALPHKSDSGGVVLSLKNRESLVTGWRQLHDSLARHCPDLILEGVLVETMGQPGREMIIGGRNDPDWGTVVLAGFGGVQAEVLRDVRLILPGQSADEVIVALGALKAGPLLRGYRGSPPLDLPALAKLIVRVGEVLCSDPAIREIDLNPVIVYPRDQGVMALDALILTHPLPPAGG